MNGSAIMAVIHLPVGKKDLKENWKETSEVIAFLNYLFNILN